MDSHFLKAQRHLIKTLVFFEVLAIFPFTPDPSGDIKILGYELFAFAALTLWLFTARHAKEAGRRSSALCPLFFAFLALNLAASFVSINVGYSLYREFIKWTALFILFVVAADAFYTPKQVWSLIGAICIAVSFASLYGLAQSKGIDPFPWEESSMLREAPATFGNPNFASHTLVLTVILACGLCTQRKGRWVLLCIPLYLYHFSLTQTRGSLLALAGALILVLVVLLVSRRVKSPLPAIALTLSIVLLVGMIGIAAVAKGSEIRTGQPYPDDISLTARYHSFYGASRMIQNKPWLGHGPGMYQVVEPEYWTLVEKERFTRSNRRSGHVHNEPLEIAVEAGLFAAIVYISILVCGLYYGLYLGFSSKDSGRRNLGLTFAAFFFAFLIDGLFGFNVHVPVSAVLLFLIAGATAGMWRERDERAFRHTLRFDRFALAWRFAVIGCAAIIPFLGIRDFSGKFHQQRGLRALHYDARTAATESFGKAASLAPYDWLPPYYLGFTAMNVDRPDQAAMHFARVLELNPHYFSAQIKIAQAMFNMAAQSANTTEMATLEQSIDYAERAAQLNPQFPLVHDLLGRASFLRAERLTGSSHDEIPEAAKKAWQEAEEHLQRAIDYGSKRKAMLYRIMAVTRLKRDDMHGAQKALIHALEDKPGEMETWQLFLQSCQKTGQYDDMRTSLDWSIELLERSQNASGELLSLYLLRSEILRLAYDDKSAAGKAFLQVVQEYPEWVDAWAAIHTLSKSIGRKEALSSTLLQENAAVTMGLTNEDFEALKGLSTEDIEALKGLSTEDVEALKGLSTEDIEALKGLDTEDIEALKVRIKEKNTAP